MQSSNPLKKMRLESGSFATLEDSTRYEGERRKTGRRTGLLDLNDDCFNAILEYVSTVDLCSIAQTSVHLKRIGYQMFDRRHQTFSFDKETTRTTIEARKLFQTFGSLIDSLNLNFSSCPKAKDIMDAVVRYCTSLECLTLHGYVIPDNQEKISGMGKLFQNLQRLHIENVTIEGDNIGELWKCLTTPNGNVMDFFFECDSLLQLKVENCDDLCRVIFESAFRHLQSFEYSGFGIDCLIDGFTFRHKYLKSFRVIQEDGRDNHLPALKVIAANCKNLEKLEIEFGTSIRLAEYETLLEKLSRLKRLRELTVDCVQEHINIFTSILPSFRDTLEVLDVSQAKKSHGLIPAICELRKLRLLRLTDCCLTNLAPLVKLTELQALSIDQSDQILAINLVLLVDRLGSLRKIQLYVCGFAIDLPTYVQLVDAVERRKDVANRTLQIECPTTNIFADSQVKAVEFVAFEPFQI